MRIDTQLNQADSRSIERRLRDFVPAQVFDIHSHLINDAHFLPGQRQEFVPEGEVWGIDTYAAALQRWLPAERLGSLCFGFPCRGIDRSAINQWVAAEVGKDGPYSRSLYLAVPEEDPQDVADELKSGGHAGLKPYPCNAARDDYYNAEIEEYAPEWMWEVCHETDGILMLHIVRDRAIADAANQAALRRLSRAYPKCRVVLAHMARSFNYRHALEGLESIADLDNVWVDTSAISESPAFDKAIELLGPGRIMFGSDYPISDFRGKCTTIGDSTHWLYGYEAEAGSPLAEDLNLIGIESLLCLREAAERAQLTQSELEDIFRENALRLLAPHLGKQLSPATTAA